MSKILPSTLKIQESLRFLLDHPRRCYTLLFPARQTWILFWIIFALNFVDVILIVTLDLDNPELTVMPLGPRILASIFQAASSRHTGTSTFNLYNVNPAVQFSLLVMMYIAVFPLAISIRSSNTYEERSLGIYPQHNEPDINNGGQSYVLNHLRNQLSFDLWYIFLGIFCICCAESNRIMDLNDPAFSVFSIFFECTSAYGNVGLSLGHPSNSTSLVGHFTPFSKLVICALMIRGRHRMLPYAMDRAIVLPSEADFQADYRIENQKGLGEELKIKKRHTH
jgi:potassium uptake Trk family protein